jgi:restriction system protein
MFLKEAIIKALKEAAKPLHVTEITRIITDTGLWEPGGMTPMDTVGAAIYVDIKRNGAMSVFTKVAPRTFALRKPHEIGVGTVPAPALTLVSSQTASQVSEPDNSATSAYPARESLTFTDSAQKVLEELGGNQPMYYRDIAKKAIEKGWLVTSGKTPEASLYAQVITEIKRQQKRGEVPRFVQLGRGYIGLSQWIEPGLEYMIPEHNDKAREALSERLLAMKPGEFEELVSELLAAMGFAEVEISKLSGDGGIDVWGTLVASGVVRIKMAVQVKKWSKNVQRHTVQTVRGNLGAHEHGLIITTSDFSAGAVTEASVPDKIPIALMNGKQLVTLLLEHGIGV